MIIDSLLKKQLLDWGTSFENISWKLQKILGIELRLQNLLNR